MTNSWDYQSTATVMTGTASSGISVGGGLGSYTVVYSNETPAGTAIKLKQQEISPQLLFKFVKSKFKFNEKQEEWHKARITKIAKMINQAKGLNQQGMYEELSKFLFIAVRESELMSHGIGSWIPRSDITKFMSTVKDRVVFFKKLEEFPRLVPHTVKLRIEVLKEQKQFDQLWILYIDYTKQEIKTNSQKVREKDPVLFGCFDANPEVMYYITDWVDEYCDLTLSSIVDALSDKDKVYKLNLVDEPTESEIQEIVDGVIERHKRLQDTQQSNWREKEREAIIAEERVKKELAEKEAVEKLSWFKKWLLKW